MNEKEVIFDVEQLKEIMRENECILYGAGRVAKTLVKFATRNQFYIKKILVSDREGNPTEILGISVCLLSENLRGNEENCLLVSVKENLHKEMETEINILKCKDVFYISDELYSNITFMNGDYELENHYSMRTDLRERLDHQKISMLRFVPRPCLEYLVLNILDHCNLRCKGCDHFACIAEPYLVSFKSIHKDLKRMAKIFKSDYIMKIGVMGGEPLLHPDLLKILKDVRFFFPYAKVCLTTNGILLMKQEKEFWQVCREKNITIVNTKYPIKLDYNKMINKAEQEGVKLIYFGDTGENKKTLVKKKINLEGSSNPVKSFSNCHISNYGNFLMEGKLYGCPFACQSYRIFNKKFNQNLRMTERDYLDIYKVKNMQEVFDFASKPKYYCRYCDERSDPFPWETSKQEMCEWVDE